MELTPQLIYEKFQNKKINITSTSELLISLIENSSDIDSRLESIKVIKKIHVKSKEVFKLLENLLISDSDGQIRRAACDAICTNFLDKALIPLEWALQHDSSYECLVSIIKTLEKMNNQETKLILIDEIKKINEKGYFPDTTKKWVNKIFHIALKKMLKTKKIEELTHNELAEILIHHKTIYALKKRFYTVYYELNNALVSKLDLTDIEYEVRGWKSEFKNDISDLSEIIGLKNLKNSLKVLYLSNNQIMDLKDLMELENLTHLYISKNKIDNIKNLEYLKGMPNLKFVDLVGNNIVQKINPEEIDTNLEIKLTREFF